MDKRKTKTKHALKARRERPKLVLLVLMALLLAAPTLASACGLQESMSDIAINENRNRLETPALDAAEAFSGTGEYFQKWDSYYNDGFGTRDLLIRIKNQLNYSLFRYNPDLFFDGEGNLYYYSVVAIQQIRNERLEDFTSILDKHAELAELCDAMGMTYVFFYPPQKNTIYQPDDLPVKRPVPIALERFYAACENDPRLQGHFVDVVETMRQQDLPVFYKLDFHWNDYGAALAYGDVINHLAELEGIATPFTDDMTRLEFETGGIKGNQLDNLSILTPIYEDAPTVQKATPITSAMDYDTPNMTHWKNQAPSPLGTALIVGDSFTPPAILGYNQTESGICDYFKEVYYINHSDVQPGFLRAFPHKVDYLIVEMIEAGLAGTVDDLEPIVAETNE